MTNFVLRQTIKQASIVIVFFRLVSLVFGIIRESVLARYFGTSAEYDVLLVALALPAMVGGILLLSINYAGIPFLREEKSISQSLRSIFRSPFLKVNHLLILTISATVFFSLPLLKHILSAGLDETQIDSIIKYGRFFCLLIPFRAYEAVFTALLHIKHHFIFPSISVLGFNIVMVGVILTFFPVLGSSIAFVSAWVFGALAETLIIAIPAYFIYNQNSAEPISQDGFSKNAYVKYLGLISIVEAMGLIVDPFDRYLGGNFLPAGYVSAVNYANVINGVPLRILAFSIGTAIFPSLSEKADNLPELGKLYHKAIAICIMLMFPISVFSLLFANEIVSLLFERGKFIAESRIITVDVLKYYLAGLIFPSLFFIQLKVFYALKSWRYLLFTRFPALFLKCLIGFLLIESRWALAIGGGTALMFAFSFLMSELYFVFKMKISYSRRDVDLLGKAFLSAFAAILLMLTCVVLFGRFVGRVHLMFITCLIGFGGLFFADRILNVSGLRLRFFRQK